MKFKTLLVIFSICLTIIFPISNSVVENFSTQDQQEEYLKKYGYIGENSPDQRLGEMVDFRDQFRLAIQNFQRMVGLNITGVVDEDTKKTMQMPRCGVVDLIGGGSVNKRRKRYLLEGSMWHKKNLTFKLTNRATIGNPSTMKAEIIRALKMWESVTSLTFVQVTDSVEADIELGFKRYAHGDTAPFDGPGKVLAHAYFPGNTLYRGDVHFDDLENWTKDSHIGIDLFIVALHEFGHTFGLAHSDKKQSIMFPTYRGYIPNAKLDFDDISAIQKLYGEKPSLASAPTTKLLSHITAVPSQPVRSATVCTAFPPDVIFTIKSIIFIFKGSFFYTLRFIGDKEAPRYNTNDYFEGLPVGLDDAFFKRIEGTIFNRTTIVAHVWFFKENLTYKYSYSNVEGKFHKIAGYPKAISVEFPGIPNNLDSVYLKGSTGKVYFVKGDQYYKYSFSRGRADGGGSRPLSYWVGAPNRIDAALSHTGTSDGAYGTAGPHHPVMFFFNDHDVYKFDEVTMKIFDGFPKDHYWFTGCPKA